MVALPDDAVHYASSPVFSNQSVPEKLTDWHNTKAGVWGKLIVLAGALDYILIDDESAPLHLKCGEHTIIAPTVYHKVALYPDTQFRIDFYRIAKASS